MQSFTILFIIFLTLVSVDSNGNNNKNSSNSSSSGTLNNFTTKGLNEFHSNSFTKNSFNINLNNFNASFMDRESSLSSSSSPSTDTIFRDKRGEFEFD